MTVIINGTNGITSVNGTAAAPSVTGTDTDTGIVYGTNTLSLVTGGTTALTIDSSQNVTFADGSKNLTLQQTTAAATNSTSYPGYIAFTGYGWNTSLGSSPLGVRIAAGGAYSPAIGQTAPGLSISTQNTNGSMTQRSILNAYGLGLGTGTLPVSGTGIAFPAAQDPSSDANTLDDYEEGTWTPAMSGATFTYSYQSGRYVKIGSFVLVQATIVATYASSTGSFYINNLPFTVVNDSNVRGGVAAINCQYGVTFNQYVTGEPINNQTNMYFENNISGSNRADMGSSNFASGGFAVRINMTYQVA